MCPYPIELPQLGKGVLPLCLQVEARGAKGVCLLLHRLLHHLPEAIRHRQTQVLCRHLTRLQNAVSMVTKNIGDICIQFRATSAVFMVLANIVRLLLYSVLHW